MLDVIGALVLVIGTIRARAAAIRALATPEAISQMSFIRRITVAATRRCGPKDVRLTTPDLIGDYMAMVWGTGFLVLGFVGQFLGQLMGGCR
jgi:hypothetical protein